MSLSANVNKVRIIGGSADETGTHTGISLEIEEKGKDTKFHVVSNQTKQDIIKGYLDEYEHVAESSNPGSLDCFENSRKGTKIIIFYSETEAGSLLDYMRRYCQGENPVLPSPPKPMPTQKINKFIQAVNNQRQDEAKRLAEDLARDRVEVRFALDLVHEGDAKPQPPPAPVPVQTPIDVRIAIESFLTGANDPQTFPCSILPGTSISDLKRMVAQQTSIDQTQQFWFIDRDCLHDDYKIGVTAPKLNPDTVLTVFIAKPKST